MAQAQLNPTAPRQFVSFSEAVIVCVLTIQDHRSNVLGFWEQIFTLISRKGLCTVPTLNVLWRRLKALVIRRDRTSHSFNNLKTFCFLCSILSIHSLLFISFTWNCTWKMSQIRVYCVKQGSCSCSLWMFVVKAMKRERGFAKNRNVRTRWAG